ncbi:MAG: methyltransferase [Pseudomonadota bacterium]
MGNSRITHTDGKDQALEPWVTVDKVLGGQLTLRQPEVGYRFAIDPVLMAAAVPAGAGDRVLDLGSGVGTASFCLLKRAPRADVSGLELQPDLNQLAIANAADNGVSDQVAFMPGDLKDRSHFPQKSFNHVMANPPHFADGSHTPPGHAGKAAANLEAGATLKDWVKAACYWAKDRGTITFIHRADRVHQVLQAMDNRCGDINIMPFWPRANRPARRVLVQALKGSRGPARVLPGITLHDPVNKYTDEARLILEQGQAIDLTSW